MAKAAGQELPSRTLSLLRGLEGLLPAGEKRGHLQTAHPVLSSTHHTPWKAARVCVPPSVIPRALFFSAADGHQRGSPLVERTAMPEGAPRPGLLEAEGGQGRAGVGCRGRGAGGPTSLWAGQPGHPQALGASWPRAHSARHHSKHPGPRQASENSVAEQHTAEPASLSAPGVRAQLFV